MLDRFDAQITAWSTAHNPFYEGAWAHALSMLPYLALCVFLYLVAREKLLSPKKR